MLRKIWKLNCLEVEIGTSKGTCPTGVYFEWMDDFTVKPRPLLMVDTLMGLTVFCVICTENSAETCVRILYTTLWKGDAEGSNVARLV